MNDSHVPDSQPMISPDNIIPPMTDPMGRHWNQPSRDEILIDDEYALMTESTMKRLAEYSCSTPSGVYPGKMWRVDYQSYCPDLVKQGKHRHWLRWFGLHPDPNIVTNHYRKILLV